MALLCYRAEFTTDRPQAEIRKLTRMPRAVGSPPTTTDSAGGMSFSLETARGEGEFLLPALSDGGTAVLCAPG
jgi:hypothetical protein